MQIDIVSPVRVVAGPRRDMLAAVRRRLLDGWHCRSEVVFAFGVSLLWLVFYNVRFWADSVHAMWHGSLTSAGFLASLFLLVWALQAVLLLLLPSRRLMLGAASVCFIVAAVGSYFNMHYGVVMNEDMLRNVFETEAAESRGLMSADLIPRLVMLGVAPALLVWKVRLPPMRWSQRLRRRCLAIAAAVTMCVAALLSCSASYAVYFREYKPVRYALVPAAPLTSAIGVVLARNTAEHGPLIYAGGPSSRTQPRHAKPLVIVVVIGETARAANFQLGGYARNTNPELSATDGLVYFRETTSCGTATALSVPCMFSYLPRHDFDVDDAPRYANLLDALQSAGVHVEWRDNNAGCKGVCARVPTIRYRHESDARLCPQSYCYDEVLLKDLAHDLAMTQSDVVIVMHQIGSHGPAYHERYPREFSKFTPACHSNQLQHCTAQEILNAYDNTIAYTDHVLARTIELLRDASAHVDPMLLYVSDHGESLGEQGIYLHGLPYAFAPDTQKRVPMLIWLAPSYASRLGVALGCLASNAGAAFSHDNLYHTVLGAAEVRNASYDAGLDILARCRGSKLAEDHEKPAAAM